MAKGKQKPLNSEQPGIAFEKVVAAIQAQIDPAAVVTHNEILVDRLGQARQFDVVVRGTFAGQKMLGVIECKDLQRKVGTPEVDAFVTKAQDVNANFKILSSRRGFSQPALTKCAHYGIQSLSLLSDDSSNEKFFIGTRWEADVTRWGKVSVTLHFVEEPAEPVHFEVPEVTIQGKRVLDWFTNYLLEKEDEITELGWVVNIAVEFDKPQVVVVRDSGFLCSAISFMAEKVCDKLEKLVGISGTGFLDWQTKRATIPSGSTIRSDSVPLDFTQWEPRSEKTRESNGFLEIRLEARAVQFERVQDAIELERL